jgi:hypothetical protein
MLSFLFGKGWWTPWYLFMWFWLIPAAGVSGPAVWGYLSGNGLLSAVTLGRIAGASAASLTNRTEQR